MNQTKESFRLASLILGLIVLIFGIYEIIERLYLQDVDMRTLHILHLVRGIGSTLMVSATVIWYMLRQRESFFPKKIRPTIELFDADGTSYQIGWFINLRWLAVLGITAAIFISQYVLNLLPQEVTIPLWVGVAALFLSNLTYSQFQKMFTNMRTHILCQIVIDLVLLTYFLHFSGGLENPLFVLYVFHVILAGLLLSRKDAYLATMIIAGFFLFLSLGEYFHILDHYTLVLFPHVPVQEEKELLHASHQLPFVLGISGSFLALLFGTAYFVISLVERLRESQQQLFHKEKLSALGQLVAYIAHEVNNPIGIISTRAKLVRSGSSQYTSAEFLNETMEIIDRQAERVGQVVKSLLGFLRPQPQSRTSVNLNQILEEVLSIVDNKISRTEILVEKSLSANLPAIVSVRNNLIHVFLNLINWIKINGSTRIVEGRIPRLKFTLLDIQN